MADEVTITTSLAYKKGGTNAKLSGTSKSDGGAHFIQNIADVGTTEEQLSKGDVVSIGYVAFHNMDESNSVQIGASTGTYALLVDPGEYAGPMAWASDVVYAKANGASIKLEYMIIESAVPA